MNSVLLNRHFWWINIVACPFCMVTFFYRSILNIKTTILKLLDENISRMVSLKYKTQGMCFHFYTIIYNKFNSKFNYRPVQRINSVAGAPAACTPLKRTCPDYSTMLINTATLPNMQLQTPTIIPQRTTLYPLPGRSLCRYTPNYVIINEFDIFNGFNNRTVFCFQ